MKKLKLFIADDHAILRESLQNSLVNHPSVESIKTFNNGEDLIGTIKTDVPDLVLLDINMPKMNGLKVCKVLKQNYPSVKVVVLSMHNSPQYFFKANAAKCDGYILKTSGLEEIFEGLKKIQSGEKYYSDAVVEALLSVDANSENKKADLTDREQEVLKLILDEYSNKEIAEKLFISLRTVDAHKRNLLAKTNSRNMTSLIKHALNEQLV